jgi:hypothetical protein
MLMGVSACGLVDAIIVPEVPKNRYVADAPPFVIVMPFVMFAQLPSPKYWPEQENEPVVL